MKTLILLCILLVGCKSSFFAFERNLPDYEDDQKIVILKLSKETSEYYIFKAKAIDYKIPFYLKTNHPYIIGEVVIYNQLVEDQRKYLKP